MEDAHHAFEAFVRDSGPALLRTATLLTGSREQGQDLLQDALERCLRRWPRIRVEFPAAYVRTTMVRLVRRRRLDGVLSRAVSTAEHEHADPADDIGTVELRQSLLAALRRLPPGQRAAVVLRHWEGIPEAETARLLGCSVGTVKSQTSRGLAALRLGWDQPPPVAGHAPVPAAPALSHPGQEICHER